MGEGIYYTFEQFNSVVLTTFVILLGTVNLMSCYFKNTKISYKIYILLINSLAIVNVFCSFFMALTENKDILFYLKTSCNFSLFVIGILFFVLLFELKGEYLHITKKLIGLYSVFYVIPTVIYFLLIANYKSIVLPMTFVMLSYMLLNYILVRIISNYTISFKVYKYISEHLKDYIFITNESDKIVYKNDLIKDSLDIDLSRYNKTNPEFIFKEFTTKVQGYENVFCVKDQFYQLIKREMVVDNQYSGMVTTFVNVTVIVKMLNNLRKKEIELRDINKVLTHHKENAYEIEKDNEIEKILNEIANTRLKKMTRIKNSIEELGELEDPYVNLNKIINEAKVELIDTREVVNMYINPRRNL